MLKNTTAIVLAAGLGVRMKSSKPKVLHAAAGRPLIDRVIDGLRGAGISKVRVVLGHGFDVIKKHLEPEYIDRAKDKASQKPQGMHFDEKLEVKIYRQEVQLGTANAVSSVDLPSLSGTVVICNGDHPLICSEDYIEALEKFDQEKCDLLVVSAVVKSPLGFGRIVRATDGSFEIVEEKEASEEVRAIDEVNSGLYVVKSEVLKKYLPMIKNNNLKKEYYLTDLVKLVFQDKLKVTAYKSPYDRTCRGVNNLSELAKASQVLYRGKCQELLTEGVTVLDPDHTYIESGVSVGAETVIGPGSFLTGLTKIGKSCVIESHCRIHDSVIGDGVEVRWGSLLENSKVDRGALIGPYARLRPESEVGEGAHIGNFVELKKTKMGARSKANHLTYLGDAEIGEDSNIGCGTITCNYAVDKKKYKTVIGKNVFVGSDSQFVAPLSVGDGAVIGSGSTITKDVPPGALAITRSSQVIKPNYKKKKD